MTENRFYTIELVHRDDEASLAARPQEPARTLRTVVAKLVAPSIEEAERLVRERYPEFVVYKHRSRPLDDDEGAIAADPEFADQPIGDQPTGGRRSST
jgi:hypothetical protein